MNPDARSTNYEYKIGCLLTLPRLPPEGGELDPSAPPTLKKWVRLTYRCDCVLGTLLADLL